MSRLVAVERKLGCIRSQPTWRFPNKHHLRIQRATSGAQNPRAIRHTRASRTSLHTLDQVGELSLLFSCSYHVSRGERAQGSRIPAIVRVHRMAP